MNQSLVELNGSQFCTGICNWHSPIKSLMQKGRLKYSLLSLLSIDQQRKAGLLLWVALVCWICKWNPRACYSCNIFTSCYWTHLVTFFLCILFAPFLTMTHVITLCSKVVPFVDFFLSGFQLCLMSWSTVFCAQNWSTLLLKFQKLPLGSTRAAFQPPFCLQFIPQVWAFDLYMTLFS